MIQKCANLESIYNGQYFLTPMRIPLLLAIEEMKRKPECVQGDLDFGCENNFCGI
jgi:hypothetical protein